MTARELKVGDRFRHARGGVVETVTRVERFKNGAVRRVFTDRVTRHGAPAWYGPTASVVQVGP